MYHFNTVNFYFQIHLLAVFMVQY